MTGPSGPLAHENRGMPIHDEASNAPLQCEGEGDTVFPTRVDAWLVLVIGAAVGFCLAQAWYLQGRSPAGSVAALAIGLLTLAFVLACTVPCRYTLGDAALHIRCGFIRQQIPYMQIQRIALSGSPVSAPALSLRRVSIVHGRRATLVSPRDRERFVAVLSLRCGLTR